MHADTIDSVPRRDLVEPNGVSCSHATPARRVALDDALGEHGLGMSEFEVLERLACDCGERPRGCRTWPVPSISARARCRARRRLEKTAWRAIGRPQMCPEDRRGIAVCLTREGRERYEAARPTHRRVLARDTSTRTARSANGRGSSGPLADGTASRRRSPERELQRGGEPVVGRVRDVVLGQADDDHAVATRRRA